MKRKIIIGASSLIALWLLCYFFIIPVTTGRSLYESYLTEKFGELPQIESEHYHYFFSIRNHGVMGVEWDVDAGIHGSYHFSTSAGAMLVDRSEQYQKKERWSISDYLNF